MIITVQTTIPGIPYSINKQEFDSQGMAAEQIDANIVLAKIVADRVNQEYGITPPGEVQLLAENKEVKLMNEKLGIDSERKSVMINALKEVIGEKAFIKLRDQIVESMDYKKISIHSSFE